jgi:S-adenosylmethionine:diacylglycerol 3-amino-3-carboxypropyl transferase
MKTGNDRVIFGHMHEDHSLELSLVDRLPVKRALVIASGGDLALSLAGAKVAVLAVDSNPAQIDLVRLKMQCPENLTELCFCGRVDSVFRYGGPFLGWLFGWPKLRAGRLRLQLTAMLVGLLPRLVTFIHGSQAGARLNGNAIRLIRRRLETAMRQPDAAKNPLLQVLLGNRFGPLMPEVWSQQGIERWRGETNRIELKVADVAQVLREVPADSLGLISVSNLLDVIDRDAWDQLVKDAARVLVSGGYLVARSMLCEDLDTPCGGAFVREENTTRDDSPLCPVVWMGRKN